VSKKYEPFLVWRRRQQAYLSKVKKKPVIPLRLWAHSTWRDILIEWLDHKISCSMHKFPYHSQWTVIDLGFKIDFIVATQGFFETATPNQKGT